MDGASVSSALEQAIQATASLVRRLQFSEGTATLDSSLVVSSSSLPPRPFAKSQLLQVEQITWSTSATRTVAASGSHQTLEQRRAGVVLARFFRMLRRRRLARRRRDMQRQDTIKHESARFIQDCWRRYIGKRKLRERQLLKRGEQRSTAIHY
ncbi:Hypothetical protein, putative [Bodo saltans]|uniref:IQ calmodulin-binding protein n=1 Tax=Bodo saltans TaxID=75058 RepID=A0A0S4IX84_BODSA|nr:Hypothetical protein, putative [Bodo saltans]|eukprot:CUF50393.1 Hypothetical protein, putative [Bodo saltans]